MPGGVWLPHDGRARAVLGTGAVVRRWDAKRDRRCGSALRHGVLRARRVVRDRQLRGALHVCDGLVLRDGVLVGYRRALSARILLRLHVCGTRAVPRGDVRFHDGARYCHVQRSVPDGVLLSPSVARG